jgi:hypothetical protein
MWVGYMQIPRCFIWALKHLEFQYPWGVWNACLMDHCIYHWVLTSRLWNPNVWHLHCPVLCTEEHPPAGPCWLLTPCGVTCWSNHTDCPWIQQACLMAELVYGSQTWLFPLHFLHGLAWADCLRKVYQISLPEGQTVLFHLSPFNSEYKVGGEI